MVGDGRWMGGVVVGEWGLVGGVGRDLSEGVESQEKPRGMVREQQIQQVLPQS